MWRCTIALMLLAFPASARDVAGILLAPPQSLPTGAELHVQLTGPTGVVAEQRAPARVADPAVDMPFVIVTEHPGKLTLQAAIYAGGVPLWVTDGLDVPAGDMTVAMGDVAWQRPTLPGGLVPMICGTVTVAVSYAPGQARLAQPGKPDLVLIQDPDTPSRYTNNSTPDTTLTRLGNRATLILQGTPLPACTPTMPAPLFPLRAQGTQPGWFLVADRTRMALARDDGVTAVAGAAQIRTMADGLALFAAPDMNLILIQTPCTDGRLPYPVQATLTTPGTTLRGCAGDATGLLAGAWVVDMIAGATMPEDDVATMDITGADVAGFAGCNRYRTSLAQGRDGALFTPAITTRISCVGPDMQLELALLAALPRVTQAAINVNGELELRDADTVLIRAYR